ncbi:MAG: tRNA (N(6)-L-threonylcarbamoyladenosine(37)-C(2))-methylthiotransferase MtaB [Prevotellaceae bacterium]|jgi:threonylcarbamoyladenosine tRNA methylthiotransferase MtaB|nr:tRNA (N(6)-L-threonylcarbamoyladenosine(37)-C(2))-methylthiotransferase MtaB [Prevotellaceae bacterium]
MRGKKIEDAVAPLWGKGASVAFYTLGCKLNFSETSTLARRFVEAGFVRAPAAQKADIYVVNTCSVTSHADKKCRQIIRKLTQLNPAALMVVTGCYAQLKPEEVAAIDGVDLVLGAGQKGDLFEYANNLRTKGKARVLSCDIRAVDSFFPAFSSGDRTRSFLKIQDGCDYHCAYCTVPLARGKSRNLPVADIVKEAETIAASGVREITLTGVNIGDFGKTTGETFFELLQALEKVNAIGRFRISSIEPNLLTDEMIEWIAQSKKMAPHFHLPLQSGSNRVLQLMRRRYRREIFAARLQKIRTLLPHAFIGVDVIAGFPGETAGDFRDTYAFLERLQPAYLHIFPYSERPGTPAAAMPGSVPPRERAARVKELQGLCDKLHRAFYEKNIGLETRVLWENACKNGMMQGFTDNYLKIETPYRRELIGRLVPVKITDLQIYGFTDLQI